MGYAVILVSPSGGGSHRGSALHQAVRHFECGISAVLHSDDELQDTGQCVLPETEGIILSYELSPAVLYRADPAVQVLSALITLDFTRPHPDLHRVNIYQLRR